MITDEHDYGAAYEPSAFGEVGEEKAVAAAAAAAMAARLSGVSSSSSRDAGTSDWERSFARAARAGGSTYSDEQKDERAEVGAPRVMLGFARDRG